MKEENDNREGAKKVMSDEWRVNAGKIRKRKLVTSHQQLIKSGLRAFAMKKQKTLREQVY
jgi:hypothetical protein